MSATEVETTEAQEASIDAKISVEDQMQTRSKTSEEIAVFFLNEKLKGLKALKILPLHDSISAKLLGQRILSDSEKIQLAYQSLTNPFPKVKPKNSEGDVVFKISGFYFISSHALGKQIHDLAKTYIKMSVGIFTDELQKFISNFQGYIIGYFSYKQVFKLNNLKIQELFALWGSKSMEQFTKQVYRLFSIQFITWP